MRANRLQHCAGFLLPDLMFSILIFSGITLSLLMGFVSLERCFAATTDFATNHADAVRISDYLALDLRRALSVVAGQNTTTLTIPSYYDATGGPQMPTLDGTGGVTYGATASPITIQYYLSGSTIYRRLGAEPAVPIAENVQDFLFTVTDSGKVVTTRITFSPTFTSRGSTANAIAGTAICNTTLLRNSRTDIASGVY